MANTLTIGKQEFLDLTKALREKSKQEALMIGKGREPNKEDAPYRPRPPGGPPWPGYPNPPPPGGIPTKTAGLLLPGETPAGGKGGLGSMNKDQLERWIKENGITGSQADKIRKKWGGLGPSLPLAQVDYSDIPNARDLKIKDAINKYGKGKDGKYKDPTMLIKTLPKPA